MANRSLTDLSARTTTADTDLIHVNASGTDYKQTKANFLQDTPKHYDATTAQSVTGTSGNYVQLPRPDAVKNKTVIAISATDWTSNGGPFWITPYGPNYDYVIIGSGVSVTGLKCRYWYL